MRFYVDPASRIPVHSQLFDQIKLAVAVGHLRPGDTLPSVRDLERDLGIGKNSIWRVYKSLEKMGLVILRQGKGAQVSSAAASEKHQGKLAECEEIANATFERLQKLQIHPSSFLSYFHQFLTRAANEESQLVFAECNRTETEIFSKQIAELWSVDIRGVTFDELRIQSVRKRIAKNAKVITNAYHLDELRELLKGTGAEVLGLKFRWDRRLMKRIESLADGSTVLFVFSDLDKARYGKLIFEEFKSMVKPRKVVMTLKGISEVGDLNRLRDQKKFGLILFSNRLWDSLPAPIKKSPTFSRPTLNIDPVSLEEVRYQVGIVW
jgi:DNA-binding transcriptional regulator YhcF (GntR family)